MVAHGEGLAFIPRGWVRSVAESIGDAGHPPYAPGRIKELLTALEPGAPVLGMDRVRKAVQERNGVIIDGTFEPQAPSA